MDKDSPLVKFVMKYWIIIVLIFSLGGVYYTNQNNHRDFEKRITALESKADTQIIESQKIQVQLAQISNDILWVKQALSTK